MSDLEGGQSFRIVVKEIGNATLKVYLRMEEDVIHMKVVDHLTKSEYANEFTLDDISRMGSYSDTEQAAAIVITALEDAAKGQNSTSTGINIMFGYTKTPKADEEKLQQDVVFDKGTLLQMKRALQRKYDHMNGDPSEGDTLVLKVELKQGFFSDFLLFELPITNKDDISGRLVIMNQDRKEEIDSLRAEVVKLTERVRKLESENPRNEGNEEKTEDGFDVSVILNDQTRARLIEFLPPSERRNRLIYRASVNGQTSANFHEYCDHQGPTVTISTANGQVFGGYSATPWNRRNVHMKDCSKTSFLFNLTQNKRFNQKAVTSNTIFTHTSYCGSFGSGSDLYFSNNCLSSAGACAPSQYEGSGYSNSSLAGAASFTPTELEVFRV